jgi:TonB family protein
MIDGTQNDGHRLNASAGHLSVHVEGAHPPEVPFLFERRPERMVPAFALAIVYQVALAAFLIWASRYTTSARIIEEVLPEIPNKQIVWLNQPGPGGGGGGGGNRMPEPPRKAELPGKDKITVPVTKPPEVVAPKPAPPEEEPEPAPQLNIPAQTLADATAALPGAIEGPAGPPSLSQGPGTGGGAGTGRGTGIGSGDGSGLGPGFGGGTGGGAYRPGNGVTLPVLIREVRPQYTSDAMRAKVQGTVLLECVVRPDGSVSDITVLRSLDRSFGLDEEAIKAARQWRFRPGTRMGETVPVLITIELRFTLR